MTEGPRRAIMGIHHVTAICGPPQENADFYTGTLGLRFVKKTVNFGDPSSYHLYYGDEVGRPGTILTFFAWPNAAPGRGGTGMAVATAWSVPASSLDAWAARLAEGGWSAGPPGERFGEPVLTLKDPDGLNLELVGRTDVDDRLSWTGGPVPSGEGTRGLHGVTLAAPVPDATARLLTEILGYEPAGEEETPGGRRLRFRSPGEAPGNTIDLVHHADPQEGRGAPQGRMGPGAIHHLAFRTEDDESQMQWRDELMTRGFEVTPVRDRHYFRSIYFHEPGGTLFEIATDPPGFTHDESVAELGTGFKLPPWLEPDRARIEARLPGIEV